MFGFVKKAFFAGLTILSSFSSINSLSWELMKKECQELMKQDIKWHETSKCKCRLNASVCNNKQRWNSDKCRCECKELIDREMCDNGFIWNPSNCKCECDKSCDVGEYLDYENCKCRKKLLDKLVDECTEVVEEVKLAKITLAENENMYKCNSCTLYIVLFSIIFTIIVGIAAYFVYFHWQLKKRYSTCWVWY